MHHAFEIIKPKIVFTTNYAAQLVSKFADEFDCKAVFLEQQSSYQAFAEPENENGKLLDAEDILAKDVDIFQDVTLILHSSGTTGLPKGVELTHANMMTSLRGLVGMNDDIRKDWGIDEDEALTYLGVAPWSHSMGFFSCMWFIFSAERFVFLDRFEPQAYLKSIEVGLSKLLENK
jgi:acyl-CoA synthetase (AMP-forming)/AMP-acid ligase II